MHYKGLELLCPHILTRLPKKMEKKKSTKKKAQTHQLAWVGEIFQPILLIHFKVHKIFLLWSWINWCHCLRGKIFTHTLLTYLCLSRSPYTLCSQWKKKDRMEFLSPILDIWFSVAKCCTLEGLLNINGRGKRKKKIIIDFGVACTCLQQNSLKFLRPDCWTYYHYK